MIDKLQRFPQIETGGSGIFFNIILCIQPGVIPCAESVMCKPKLCRAIDWARSASSANDLFMWYRQQWPA